MKVTRACKLRFERWLTPTKSRQLRRLLHEYHRVVTEAIKTFEPQILAGMKKTDLLLAANLHQVDSWLTARAKKNAFAEAHALVSAASEASKALKTKYRTPKHALQMMLSETNATLKQDAGLKEFDLLLRLSSMDGLKTKDLAIPLKKNKHFNKFVLDGWELAGSVLVTKYYIQVTFSKKVDKKETGGIIGVDPGATNLLTTDDGRFFGKGIRPLLDKQKRKARGRKAWWRCRHEIRQYIDKSCKDLPWDELRLVVLEDNRKIKNKMKLRGRLGKNMRSLLSGWAIGRISERVEMLSQSNGVRLRRVPAFNNSRLCPDCGSTDQRNRASQDEFICVECGCFHHADVVGGMNSLARLCLGPYGAEFKREFVAKHPGYFAIVS